MKLRGLSRRKYAVFALMTMALTTVVGVGTLLAVDVYLHGKLATAGGLNVWGYRGPSVGRKQPRETRVAVIGGSTAFGYGVRWHEAFPAYLQDLLNNRLQAEGRTVSVVNLAYNNEGAHSLQFTLQDYAYLDFDAVVIYSGYNDLGLNLSVYRRTSAVFRLTGYMPILPLVLREKAMTIRYNGNLDAAYRKEATVYRPNVVQRAAATSMTAVASAMGSLDRPQNSEGAEPDPDVVRAGAECGPRWAHYCGSMLKAITLALAAGKDVLMVSQPRSLERPTHHVDQQAQLVAFLTRRFGSNPRLRFANLMDVVNLADTSICYDGLHLKPEGNRMIAERLLEPVLEMIR